MEDEYFITDIPELYEEAKFYEAKAKASMITVRWLWLGILACGIVGIAGMNTPVMWLGLGGVILLRIFAFSATADKLRYEGQVMDRVHKAEKILGHKL